MKKLEGEDFVDMGIQGANLVFSEFSFETPKGHIYNIYMDQMVSLQNYLDEKYGVEQVMCCGIFLIIRCRQEVLVSHQRPFTIARLIGV